MGIGQQILEGTGRRGGSGGFLNDRSGRCKRGLRGRTAVSGDGPGEDKPAVGRPFKWGAGPGVVDVDLAQSACTRRGGIGNPQLDMVGAGQSEGDVPAVRGYTYVLNDGVFRQTGNIPLPQVGRIF